MSLEENELDDVVGLTDAELEAIKEEEEEEEEEEETSSIHDDEEQEEEEEQEEVKVESAPFVPEYKAESIPEDIQSRLDADYAALSNDLDEKYENGDLSFSDYRKQSRDLDSRYFAEKEKITAAKLKAEIAEEQQRQTAEQKWQWEQDTFFRDNPDFRSDPILFGALNSVLQASYGDENSKGKSGLQLIREAAEKVKTRFDVKPIANNQQTRPDKKIEVKGQSAKATELPKTLSNIPSADSSLDNGGEFDYLENLSGLAYEKAIAKLSPDALDRFLNS